MKWRYQEITDTKIFSFYLCSIDIPNSTLSPHRYLWPYRSQHAQLELWFIKKCSAIPPTSSSCLQLSSSWLFILGWLCFFTQLPPNPLLYFAWDLHTLTCTRIYCRIVFLQKFWLLGISRAEICRFDVMSPYSNPSSPTPSRVHIWHPYTHTQPPIHMFMLCTTNRSIYRRIYDTLQNLPF